MSMFPTILGLLALPTLSAAWTWNFVNTPQQCSNLTISILGADAQPPFRVLIIPFGPTPLSNNIEARKIIDQQFSGTPLSVTFKLTYPANSQFVAVVSDATGFGSGGTSVAAEVTTSSDSSCFDATANVVPLFFFNLQPANQIVQCVPTRLWWDKTKVQGTPNFLGVIPGGQSFAIPQGTITDVDSEGTGFSWTPPLRGATTLILVGGDSRGNGTAGSTLNIVSSGLNNIGSCLSNSSPSSTPAPAAGGAYPTSSTGGVGGGGGGGGTNIGAIVGGVVGAVVAVIAIALLLFFFRRRSRVHKKQKERPVDLLNSDEGDESPPGNANGNNRNELPEYYQPEPFTVPDPTTPSIYDGHTDGTTSDGRPLSAYTSLSQSDNLDLTNYGAGSTTTGGGRKGALRQMRPVNIIQHDDAGPSGPPKDTEGVETVELPPAYTNIRQ